MCPSAGHSGSRFMAERTVVNNEPFDSRDRKHPRRERQDTLAPRFVRIGLPWERNSLSIIRNEAQA